jgi:hypothetical protein
LAFCDYEQTPQHAKKRHGRALTLCGIDLKGIVANDKAIKKNSNFLSEVERLLKSMPDGVDKVEIERLVAGQREPQEFLERVGQAKLKTRRQAKKT